MKIRPYTAIWKMWWLALQPDWRGTEQWPFDRSVTLQAEDWTPLLRGGSNGTYLIIVSLGWLLAAASKVRTDRPNDWQDALTILEDVEWVFGNLLAQARTGVQTAQKRTASEDASPVSKKRRKA